MSASPEAAVTSVRELIRRECPLAQPVLAPELELHRHLGFSANDLRRLVRVLHQAFGTDFGSLDVNDYAPASAPDAFGAPTCEIVALSRRRPLTVGDLEAAVVAGRWREAG